MRRLRRTLHLPTLLAAFALLALSASAQQLEPGAPTASLRPYWHVFVAYAVTLVLVIGWVVSISKRLATLERQLGE